MTVYFSLFVSGFLAATLLPAFSEITLGALLLNGYSTIGLWAAATLGNSLGACVNWLIGRYLRRFQSHKYFPLNKARLEKAETLFNRYGKWTLLFSWLPVIGDPLTLVAGTTRVRFMPFLVLVATGKGLRYAMVVAIALSVV